MSNTLIAACLSVAYDSCSHRDGEAWRRIAALSEAAVTARAHRWRHPVVGAAALGKRAARLALFDALAQVEAPWARWLEEAWARRLLRCGARCWREWAARYAGRVELPAAIAWYLAQEAQRRRWRLLLREAGRALATEAIPGAVSDAALRLVLLGVPDDWALIGGMVARRGGMPWLSAALVEGWRPPGARVELVTGPMGSGKSTKLVEAAALGAVLVQSSVNSRDGGSVRTHDGLARPAIVRESLSAAVLEALGVPGSGYIEARALTIGVDEGQWWRPDEWALGLAACAGHDVRIVVAALDTGAADAGPIGSAAWLLRRADRIRWCQGRCVDCGAPSVLTRWDGAGAPGVGVIGVGAYRPVCRACWRAPGGGR